ncbi:hypothetical protein BDN72DRAFT_642421 [Pluteus cervinus]|uniref:Uncharacterized protein n=1 Tax=Pluteus cervinus TaxID=181527 RepID=A0ACD3ATT6_9AGAR|nr:hypothetical protein BDN72DRAFT_642421 [Pluteus cervinus]
MKSLKIGELRKERGTLCHSPVVLPHLPQLSIEGSACNLRTVFSLVRAPTLSSLKLIIGRDLGLTDCSLIRRFLLDSGNHHLQELTIEVERRKPQPPPQSFFRIRKVLAGFTPQTDRPSLIEESVMRSLELAAPSLDHLTRLSLNLPEDLSIRTLVTLATKQVVENGTDFILPCLNDLSLRGGYDMNIVPQTSMLIFARGCESELRGRIPVIHASVLMDSRSKINMDDLKTRFQETTARLQCLSEIQDDPDGRGFTFGFKPTIAASEQGARDTGTQTSEGKVQ